MEDLELRCLNKNDEAAHKAFMQEFIDAHEKFIPSSAFLKELNYLQWLKYQDNMSKGINIPEDKVPATMYCLFREGDSKILGAIHIRHELNDFLLKKGGNIGYGVVPSERKKGYGNKMLSLALNICKEMGIKKALITCDKDNIGSARTIQKNGGTLENETIEADGNVIQRYWINL